jgi:multidrug efflux pump subunit AcrA (membrane-fusion protein)
MFVPLFRDQEHAWYVVEPQHSATVHAAVPGHIDSVLVHEGERVRAGQPMITLSSPFASALTASADALTSKSRYRAFDAELQGQSIGGASANQLESQHSVRIAKEAQSSRIIDAPFDGVVLTHDPSNLQGQEVVSGQELLSLADSGPRLVRIFVPAPALPRIPPSAEVEIEPPGRFSMLHMWMGRPGGDPVQLPPGLIARQDYKGVKLPVFYAARVTLPPSAGEIPIGASGNAKIFGDRHSLASRLVRIVSNSFGAHFW